MALLDRAIPEPNSGCWIWVGATNSDGYGWLWRSGRSVRVHRIAWEITKGPIPTGLHVLHRCDVPACIRPSHLFLGTHIENMQDASRKRRLRPRGRSMNATHCANGHERTPENYSSGRRCRRCDADTSRARRRKKKNIKMAKALGLEETP